LLFLFEFWEVVAVHLPPFPLHLEEVSLLSLVVNLPCTLSLLELLQLIPHFLRLLAEIIDSAYQILIDILFDNLVLHLRYLLEPLHSPYILIDLRIHSCNIILQPFDPNIAALFFFLARQSSDGALVHLDLLISVL
jgi:hypothetical protein